MKNYRYNIFYNFFHITEMKNITEIKNSDEFTLSSEFPEFIQTNHNICPDIYLIFLLVNLLAVFIYLFPASAFYISESDSACDIAINYIVCFIFFQFNINLNVFKIFLLLAHFFCPDLLYIL